MLYKKSILKRSFISCIIFILIYSYNFCLADDLKSTNNQADYLIISTTDFLENLDQLISLRETQGLTTRAVHIDTLYRQFQDTLSKQDAIKQFVSYTLEYWSEPKPQYLLLVGDVEFVPSYKVQSRFHDTEFGEDSVSIDDQFAINLHEDDPFPDIAIGRLPVSDNQQLQNIVEKTILLEDNLKREDYITDYLGLADFRENEYVFEQIQDNFTKNILPDYYSWQRIDRRIESSYYGTNLDILDILNQGCLFLYYSGHGSPFTWADTSFFQVEDIGSLVPNGLPIFFTAAACKQNIDITDSTSIIEALIRKKYGGTVISFTSSGLSYASLGSQIIKEFFKILFEHPDYSVGNIIQQVKHEQMIGIEPDDLTLRYTLLGDPALKFPADIISGMPESEYELLSEFELHQNFPNPFNSTTVIKVNVPKAGIIFINVYDVKGAKVDVIQEGILNQGEHSLTWNPIHLSSGIYFIHMTANQINQTIRALYIK